MSFVSKVFRKNKKPAKNEVTAGDAIQKLRETEEMLLKKQEFLESKIEQELAIAKKNGTKKKQAALQALKRKKRYEKQLQQIDGTLSTLEFQREALENAHTNTEMLKTMNQAAAALKTVHSQLGVDDVNDLMDEISEQQTMAIEISEAISQPVRYHDDVDEDELERELEELQQDELEEELVSLPNLPLPPTKGPTGKVKSKVEEDDDDMKELAAWGS